MKVASVIWVYKEDDAVFKWVKQSDWENLPDGCRRCVTLTSANLKKEHLTVGTWGQS